MASPDYGKVYPEISYGVPNPAFVVPSSGEENGYHDSPSLNYAPRLRSQPGSTPDPLRTGETPVHGYRPQADQPPDRWWHILGPGMDILRRHRVETTDGDGWEELKGGSGRPAAPNPRATPPPETRPTERMAPVSYWFTRPFDQHSARRFNGMHFSMADHRRNYSIGGMGTVRTARNTYRIDPPPWDANMGDAPPVMDPIHARIQQVEVPSISNRAWRLT